MITIHTKEGYSFFKELSNDLPNIIAQFDEVTIELETFLDDMKEKSDDLYKYNVLLDKYLILQSKLHESHYLNKVLQSNK